MLTKSKTVTINAQSSVNNKVAMQMYANVPQEGSANVSATIMDRSAYKDNLEQVNSDYEEFMGVVNELLQGEQKDASDSVESEE